MWSFFFLCSSGAKFTWCVPRLHRKAVLKVRLYHLMVLLIRYLFLFLTNTSLVQWYFCLCKSLRTGGNFQIKNFEQWPEIPVLIRPMWNIEAGLTLLSSVLFLCLTKAPCKHLERHSSSSLLTFKLSFAARNITIARLAVVLSLLPSLMLFFFFFFSLDSTVRLYPSFFLFCGLIVSSLAWESLCYIFAQHLTQWGPDLL